MSFRLKTVLGIALIELSVMAILIVVNQLNYGGTASAQLYERARATSELFSTMVADAVISTDLATLDAMIANTLVNDDLGYLRVRNGSGVVLSADGNTAMLEAAFREDASFDEGLADNRIDISAPISIGGQTYGAVELGMSTRQVEADMESALRWNMGVAAIGMTLVGVFGYLLGSVLTRQLSSLREGATMIAKGDLGFQIAVRGRDELAETATCFNEMATSLATERAEVERNQAVLIDKRDRTQRIVLAMTGIAEGAPSVSVPHVDREDEIGDMARATVVFRNAMNEVQVAREEQAQLIHAFDQLEEQVVIFDEEGHRLFNNAAFRNFNADIMAQLPTAFTFEDFLAEGLKQDSFPGAVGREREWLANRLQPITEDEVAVEIACAPDRTLLLQRTSVNGIGMVVSASDVTELKTSQAQLVQASKLATLGEMATGIAHELNQPLGVIRMAANNCLKRVEKGRMDETYLVSKLERMSAQTERASQIIDHMRVFGRSDDGKRSTFGLDQALDNACNLMRKQLQVSGISLSFAPEMDGLYVTGQQVMFEQVILNLISNARDAIEAGSKGAENSGQISVSVEMGDEGRASVLVQDNGGGIPEAVLDRLFDPFFTTKEPGKGTGLGLSISYGIVRDIGGVISATNTREGARFEISLPLSAVDAGDTSPELKSA